MNCKPNELAMIVRTMQPISRLLGVPIKVLDLHMSESRFGPIWNIELPRQCECGNYGSVTGEDFGTRKMATTAQYPDAWLRPIRPDSITDTEVSELYAPSVVMPAVVQPETNEA